MIRVLMFGVNAAFFAVPMETVHQVLRHPVLTTIPLSPTGLLGVVNVRGEIVPLLDTGVLTGTGPLNQAPFAGILREAHTMKGAAGMVGMMRVSHLAHRLEDLLVELRAGTRRSTPELTDAMLLVVDGLGRLVASAAGGEQDASDEAALERLLPTSNAVPAVAVVTAPAAATPPVRVVVPAVAVLPVLAVPPAFAVANSTSPSRPGASPSPQVGKQTDQPQKNGRSDKKVADSATLQVPVARIDELNRLLGEASAAQLRVGHVFGTELHMDPDALTEYRELTKVINQLQEVTERTRMGPVGTLEPILHRTLRDSARLAGKNVRWEMVGEEVEVDRGVLEELVNPLLHLIRNSVGHGVESPDQRRAAGKPEPAVVRLHATQAGSKAIITVSDDGARIDA